MGRTVSAKGVSSVAGRTYCGRVELSAHCCHQAATCINVLPRDLVTWCSMVDNLSAHSSSLLRKEVAEIYQWYTSFEG